MKRFTETAKWNDPWFQDLSMLHKLFWNYLCDQCDHAGVWAINLRLAEFQLGQSIDIDMALKAFGKRIECLSDTLWLIVRFVPFQYPNLSPDCKPHKPVFDALEKHGLSQRYSKGIESLQEKDKDKDKDKETVKEKDKEAENPRTIFFKDSLGSLYNRRASTAWDPKEVKTLKEILKRPECDGELQEISDHYQATGKTPDAKYLKQNLATLLNQWQGELDKIRSKKNHSMALPKVSSAISQAEASRKVREQEERDIEALSRGQGGAK